MANVVYPKAKERALTNAGIQFSTGDIKAILVKIAGGGETYTYNAAHEFRSSLHNDTQISTSGNLIGKSVTNGIAKATDIAFAAVVGDPCGAVVLFRDTGDPDTDELIAYIDTASGLPVTPNGGNIAVEWDDGSGTLDGIFQL
jgi:hypothetical protein